MPRSLRKLLAGLVATVAVVLTVLFGAIATGKAGFVVTHGVSMNPVYYQGDLVVIAKKPSYAINQIVAYHRPGHSDVVLHRIIGGDARGYTFKGDNNRSIDPTKPIESQLAGTAVLHIARGGIWLKRLTRPAVLAGFAFLLMGAGGTAAVQTRRQRKRRGTMSRHAARTRSTPSLTGLPEPLRIAAAASAAAGVIALAVGGFAWTGPLTSLATVKQDSSRSVTFSYSAAVPRSPAYDGTVVTAPQPVFRKLANIVDVTYTYEGTPTDKVVDVTLANGSGWSSTLRLAAKIDATGSRSTGTIRLDLRRLEQRATAASSVTGLPSDALTVTVAPHLAAAGGPGVTPALSLALTPLTLKLAGDAKTTFAVPTVTTRNTVVNRTLLLVGHAVPVHTARLISALLLLLSVLGLSGLYAGGRFFPASEAARLRRRHANLLVEVQPVPAPATRPYVDVRTATTLIRIAERYGSMILHWSRSGVETFIVQDEAVTFRYRTAVAPGGETQAHADLLAVAPGSVHADLRAGGRT